MERDPGQEWMLSLQAGDTEAFEKIVLRYEDRVRNLIRRYLPDLHRAQDVAQEAFLRVYRARNRYQPTARFQSWLYTIVTRLCRNEILKLRRDRRMVSIQQGHGGESGHDPDGETFIESLADERAEGPDLELERRELEAVIRESIARLPASQREAIRLFRRERTPYQEIAATLGASVPAVKSRLKRARDTLRKCINDYRGGESRRSCEPVDGVPARREVVLEAVSHS